MNQKEFEFLCALEKAGETGLSLEEIAERTEIEKQEADGIADALKNRECVAKSREQKLEITQTGREELEPYRVKRAVIIAAGFGSRMVPITWNTPKPLVRVHGKQIIETLLDAITEAEIPEVVLVRGYLWEQFDSLLYKYPKIRFVQNDDYIKANNISSVYMARDLLEGAYVCEADLYVSNPSLIRKYEYASNYLGVYREHTDDWCFQVKDHYIEKILIGGNEVHHMFGISYWDHEDGKKLKKCVEEAYTSYPGGPQLYWDEIALKLYIDQFKVQVRPCSMKDIVEIDTFQELQEIDPIYKQEGEM